MVRYYLPVPYVQVTVYEVRSLGETRLHPVVRSTAVPDVAHPILMTDDYSMLVEHGLRVTLSREGFLERVSYSRKPKALEAAGAVARAVLSAVAPVPLPFKGDPDFPEFSRVVFQKNYPLCDLLRCTEENTGCCGSKDVNNVHVENIAGREFHISAKLLNGGRKGPCSGFSFYPTTNSSECALPDILGKRVSGFYHRPLVPVEVTLKEQGNNSAEIQGEPVLVKKVGADLQVFAGHKPPDENASPKLELVAAPWNGLAGGTNLIKAHLKPAHSPVEQHEIIYCADPQQVDAFYFPMVHVAPQELDLRFSAGTVYDVRSHRESEVMAAVNSLLGVPGAAIGTVSGIFTVNVHHDGEGKANGGSKDPGGNRPPIEKE